MTTTILLIGLILYLITGFILGCILAGTVVTHDCYIAVEQAGLIIIGTTLGFLFIPIFFLLKRRYKKTGTIYKQDI